mmetsp:Transcript_73943/g.165911  ORF Transcript_73943/g.165911 Transcript_73943/m.165911 type:complete len:391 (-) Transcript_73943:84-1256(-)
MITARPKVRSSSIQKVSATTSREVRAGCTRRRSASAASHQSAEDAAEVARQRVDAWVATPLKDHWSVQDKDTTLMRKRMAAYSAERLATRPKSSGMMLDFLRKTLQDIRRPPSPDKPHTRMVAYETQRKVSLEQEHDELLVKANSQDFKLISLGSSCAVNLTLVDMNLRQEAYPFDNMRTSLEGVLHFLETNFSDFMPGGHADASNEPGGMSSQRGKYHSFWHHNMQCFEDVAKYERRIQRFMDLDSSDKNLFFVFALNSSFEVVGGERLLRSLRQLFGKAKVWVLMLVDGQVRNRLMSVGGTEDRLLIFCMMDGHGGQFLQEIKKGVSSFIEHVQTSSTVDIIQSCAALEPGLVSYTGGDPRAEMYSRRLWKHGGMRAKSLPSLLDAAA